MNRPLTRFERISFRLGGTVLVLAIIFSIIPALGYIQDINNRNKVAKIANQIKSPKGCQRLNTTSYSVGQVFGTGHVSDLTFSCKNTTVAQVVADARKNFGEKYV